MKPINRWWDINSGAGLVCLKTGLGKSSYIRGIRSSARCGVLAAQIGLRQATRRSVLRTLTPVRPVPGCRLYAYRSSIRLLKNNGLSYSFCSTNYTTQIIHLFVSLSPWYRFLHLIVEFVIYSFFEQNTHSFPLSHKQIIQDAVRNRRPQCAFCRIRPRSSRDQRH